MPGRIQGGWRLWLTGVLVAICALGCKGFLGSQGPPADPLFVSRKPRETKAEKAAPVAVAFAEPEVPPDPSIALVKALPPKPNAPGPNRVPGILTNRPIPKDDE